MAAGIDKSDFSGVRLQVMGLPDITEAQKERAKRVQAVICSDKTGEAYADVIRGEYVPHSDWDFAYEMVRRWNAFSDERLGFSFDSYDPSDPSRLSFYVGIMDKDGNIREAAMSKSREAAMYSRLEALFPDIEIEWAASEYWNMVSNFILEERENIKTIICARLVADGFKEFADVAL